MTEILLLQVLHCGIKYFRDVSSTEFSVEAFIVDVITHNLGNEILKVKDGIRKGLP